MTKTKKTKEKKHKFSTEKKTDDNCKDKVTKLQCLFSRILLKRIEVSIKHLDYNNVTLTTK